MDGLINLLETIVNVGNEYLWGWPNNWNENLLPALCVILVGSGMYITWRMRFIQVRQFRHAIDVIRGKFDDPKDEGDINHFQALTTALSATVGIGNIAGVAMAIHYGGPGAIFWMWITAFFGMSLKYAECTLSMKYRVFDEVGNASGGPMYYIEKGMGGGTAGWAKAMAVFFAFCAIISSFGGGNMNQANTVAQSAAEFNVPPLVSGVIMATLVALVILGGIRRIGKVTGKLAPAMASLYIFGALLILILNIDKVPGAIALIFSEAINPTVKNGGALAGSFTFTLLWGIKRGLFSNEAGQGSAPIAHAAAKTDEPVREGVVAMVGPFIDTLVICTMTALVILISGVWNEKRPEQLPMASVSVQVEGTSVAVRNGMADTIVMYNDAPMDDVVYFVDGKRLTGQLTVEGDKLVSGSGAEVMVHGKGLQNGSVLTSWAFARGFERIGMPAIGKWIVTLSVFLFALSTAISWSYYGDRCTQYLFGHQWVIVYRVIYVAFIVLGAYLTLDIVWAYGDFALGLMTLPNLIAVVVLAGTVRKMTDEYESREHEPNKE